MAEVNPPISSGAIAPESEPLSPPTKRRRPSASPTEAKRPRLSSDARSQSPTNGAHQIPHSHPAQAESKPAEASQDRRKASIQEERKRGQRLFGGLLSTLSQTTPNNQQKRRQEIERRQQERAKQQKVADEGKRKERLANLKVIREAEQVKFDEQTMKVRHSNLLAMANFLCTKTDPKLYYKPWELQPSQETRIKTQIANARAQIEEEVAQFARQHPEFSNEKAFKEKSETNDISEEEPVGKTKAESPSASISRTADDNIAAETTNSHVPPPNAQAASNQRKRSISVAAAAQEEHNGEVFMENDEDAVIY